MLCRIYLCSTDPTKEACTNLNTSNRSRSRSWSGSCGSPHAVMAWYARHIFAVQIQRRKHAQTCTPRTDHELNHVDPTMPLWYAVQGPIRQVQYRSKPTPDFEKKIEGQPWWTIACMQWLASSSVQKTLHQPQIKLSKKMLRTYSYGSVRVPLLLFH